MTVEGELIHDGYYPQIEKEGNPVSYDNCSEKMDAHVITTLAPVQAGSGDASPNNVRAITGWTGAGLTRCGKNLSSGLLVQGTRGTTGVLAVGTGHTAVALNDLVSVVPGMTIYVNTSVGAFTNTYRYYLYDADRQLISTAVSAAYNAGISIPDGAAYFAFQYSNSDYADYIGAYAMLADGEFADYEPYSGDDYTADFGQTIYGGRVNWQTGTVTVDRAAVTLDGTEDWIAEYENSFYTNTQYYDCVGGGTTVVSSMFPSKYGYVSSGDNIYISTSKRINVQTDAVAHTIDAFRALLAEKPLTVVYPLAKPTTLQLTPQEIKQLNGTNTLYGDGTQKVAFNAGDNISGSAITLLNPEQLDGRWLKIDDTAASATKLATARTIQTNLASTSAVSFDGTANISTGVTGTLKVTNGGTGSATAPTQGGIIYASSTSAYASTIAGTSGYLLKSNGTMAPTWIAPSDITAGSASKVANTLTIQTNGTTLGTFNGSAAATLNITYSNVGAAASSHTHSYLPLSGGTLTGALTTNGVVYVKNGLDIANSTQYPSVYLKSTLNTSASLVVMYANTNSTTGFNNPNLFFRCFSPTSAGATTMTNYYEDYRFPKVDNARTGAAYYDVLTTKSPVTVAQGGTGATSKAGARINLGFTVGTSFPESPSSDDIHFLFS